MNNRTSIIWKLTKNQFSNIIKESKSYREVLRKLGLESKGGNPTTLKKRIKEDKLDDSHILNRPKNFMALCKTTIPLTSILIDNSNYNRTSLKRRLIKDKLLEYKCKKCDNIGEWQGIKLVLQLDHENGVSTDNTLANLRFLCPNCHSQTSTFAGKSLKKKIKISELNPEWRNKDRIKQRKVLRPSREELQFLIKNTPFTTLGKKYNVSDNAVRKWCKRYNLI